MKESNQDEQLQTDIVNYIQTNFSKSDQSKAQKKPREKMKIRKKLTDNNKKDKKNEIITLLQLELMSLRF